MKYYLLLVAILLSVNSYAQLEFNGFEEPNFKTYEEATLNLRNGEVLKGEAKITFEDEVKFRKDKEKQVFNYRELKSFEIKNKDQKLFYVYKILAGKEPRLMRVLKESKDRVNLYVISYKHTNSAANMFNATGDISTNVPSGVSLTINEYYINKGSGHEVIKIGNDHPVFGKGKFKRNAIDFFEDCPDLVKKIEDNDFKRSEMLSIADYYDEHCASNP